MNSIPVPHKFDLDFRNSGTTIHEVISLLQEKYFYVFSSASPCGQQLLECQDTDIRSQGLSATSVNKYRIMTVLVTSLKPVEGVTEAVEVCFVLS
jgi:hypothetical protein